MAVTDLLEAYALDPTEEGLGSLQAAIMQEPTYDPMVLVSGSLTPLRREGKHQEIIARITSWMPGVLLSPSAHGYLARSLADLGETASARIEQKFARLALESIAATGSGSEDEPCAVLRIEDEYDVLRASSQRPVSQRQVSDDRGSFDVHTLDDGAEVWFRLLWLPQPTPAAQG